MQTGWSQWNHGHLEQHKWNPSGQWSSSLSSSWAPTEDQGGSGLWVFCPWREAQLVSNSSDNLRPEGTSRNVTWWGWLTLLINLALGFYAFNDFLFLLIMIRLLHIVPQCQFCNLRLALPVSCDLPKWWLWMDLPALWVKHEYMLRGEKFPDDIQFEIVQFAEYSCG